MAASSFEFRIDDDTEVNFDIAECVDHLVAAARERPGEAGQLLALQDLLIRAGLHKPCRRDCEALFAELEKARTGIPITPTPDNLAHHGGRPKRGRKGSYDGRRSAKLPGVPGREPHVYRVNMG